MKKFNWGTGIVLAVTLFVIATLSVVSYMISLDFYLVSNDHYQEGVEYQQTIDKKQRAENLKNPVVVLFDEPTVSIKLIFPKEILTDSLSGNVTFYRPNNPELDKRYKLDLDQEGRQSIPVGEFEQGRWKLTVEWQSDSLLYIEEKNIFI
ncbi:MAG: FixH family protein [Gracilimonas sp.]|uniref:FixH family protein n=1 Tax=Gracilimonas TaxID=649462 RepID=UPI001B2F4EBD|nr:FixH family protein [Gracilimonas sp.]MBO6585801.1 FixH family protein [Gracilimonas sp.]MBO6616798.1 FixH family protein [Gracilimonas sp.]